MDFMFVDSDTVKRGILINNMTGCEQEYAGLEVALVMQQTLAADTNLPDDTRQTYMQQIVSVTARMTELDAQWSAWKTQLDALPAA